MQIVVIQLMRLRTHLYHLLPQLTQMRQGLIGSKQVRELQRLIQFRTGMQHQGMEILQPQIIPEEDLQT